jgi:hypothetical protein
LLQQWPSLNVSFFPEPRQLYFFFFCLDSPFPNCMRSSDSGASDREGGVVLEQLPLATGVA